MLSFTETIVYNIACSCIFSLIWYTGPIQSISCNDGVSRTCVSVLLLPPPPLPLVTPKRRGIETSSQRGCSLNSLNNNWHNYFFWLVYNDCFLLLFGNHAISQSMHFFGDLQKCVQKEPTCTRFMGIFLTKYLGRLYSFSNICGQWGGGGYKKYKK